MYNNTTVGFVIMTDRHPVLHVSVLLRNDINSIRRHPDNITDDSSFFDELYNLPSDWTIYKLFIYLLHEFNCDIFLSNPTYIQLFF